MHAKIIVKIEANDEKGRMNHIWKKEFALVRSW